MVYVGMVQLPCRLHCEACAVTQRCFCTCSIANKRPFTAVVGHSLPAAANIHKDSKKHAAARPAPKAQKGVVMLPPQLAGRCVKRVACHVAELWQLSTCALSQRGSQSTLCLCLTLPTAALAYSSGFCSPALSQQWSCRNYRLMDSGKVEHTIFIKAFMTSCAGLMWSLRTPRSFLPRPWQQLGAPLPVVLGAKESQGTAKLEIFSAAAVLQDAALACMGRKLRGSLHLHHQRSGRQCVRGSFLA